MTGNRRVLLLLAVAAILALAGFGPGLYERSLPLTTQVAHLGGHWRTFRAGGKTYRGIVHHIAKYCYSPGQGVIVEADSAAPDTLLALATTLAQENQDVAVADSDWYITVDLAVRGTRVVPWDEGVVLSYGYHRSSSGQWKFMSFAAPPGYRPTHRGRRR